MMKLQSLRMVSGNIQSTALHDTVEQLQDEDWSIPAVRPPSNTLAHVLCHNLQDLKVLVQVEEDDRIPMIGAPLKPVK